MFFPFLLAWLGFPSHRYRVTGSEAKFRWWGVIKGSKVSTKVHTDAGRALCVVWCRTQVAHPILLQAAWIATSFRGCVVAGGRGTAAGHLLKGAGEDSAGSARQAGKSSGLGHRLARCEGQALDRELCVVAGSPASCWQGYVLVFILAAAATKPTLFHGLGPQVQRGDAVAYSDGGWGHVSPHTAWPHSFIYLWNIHQLIRGTQIHCICETDTQRENNEMSHKSMHRKYISSVIKPIWSNKIWI